MNRYETLFILHPELSEAKHQETVERLQRLAESMGGREITVEDWGLRDLAYLVRRQSRGRYVRIEYTARPEVVNEMERTMKLTDEILRFVSVRLPKAGKAPAVARARPSRPATDSEATTAE